MFVITTKVSKTKLAAGATLVIAALVLVGVLTAARRAQAGEDAVLKGESNDDRVAWLAQCGWEVNAEPVETQSVKIPTEDSELFARYNELQMSQGFDLRQYAGRQATRYVYQVLNYPNADKPVYATVFVLKGRIVGGDVTDSSPNGKMQGIVKAQNRGQSPNGEEERPKS